MKILHTSDWHVGRTMRGRSRADEHRAVLDEIVAIAGDSEVDLVLIAGDVFDSTAPSPEAEQIVFHALLQFSDIAPVVLVAGNHDNAARLAAVAPLLDLAGIIVADRINHPSEGGVVRIESGSGEVARIALLPFVSQRGIVRADDLMGLDPDDHAGKYAARLSLVINRLVEDVESNEINIVLGHHTVVGADTGGGERAAHTVMQYRIPPTAFPGHLSYVALGHLHKAQRVPAGCPIWYSGSPLQLDFGEAGQQKAVLVADATPGLPVTVEQFVLSSGRSLVSVAGTLEQVAGAAGEFGDDYLRVQLDESARAGLADEVHRLFPNAVEVVVVLNEAKSGIKEAPRRIGRPPADLFGDYLDAANASDERVLDLFSRLLDEIHET